MLPKQSLNWILEVESNLPDINFSVLGVDCWPIIRNAVLHKINSTNVTDKANISYSCLQLFFLFFNSLFSLIFVKPVSCFVLSDAKFSEEIGGVTYLKEAHVIVERYAEEGRDTAIALLRPSGKNIANIDKVLPINALAWSALLASRVSFLLLFIPGFNSYTKSICQELCSHPDGAVKPQALRKLIFRSVFVCLVASLFFSFVLKRAKPKKAFVVCYYSLLGMAFCSACHRLGIHVSDLQHGVSGKNMRSYASWSRCPRVGYTTLPNEFICWALYDSKAINDWVVINNSPHTAVSVGNIWRDYVLNSRLIDISTNEWRLFINRISGFNEVVIFTTQPTSFGLLESLREIRRRYKAACFLIRLHPSSDPCLVKVIHDEFAGEEGVYIDEPTRMPIQLIMASCTVHFTYWSAAVYDAYFAGVKSYILTEAGSEYFSDFIDEGFAQPYLINL